VKTIGGRCDQTDAPPDRARDPGSAGTKRRRYIYYEIYPFQAAIDAHKQTLAAFFREYGPPASGLFAKPTETEIYRILVE